MIAGFWCGFCVAWLGDSPQDRCGNSKSDVFDLGRGDSAFAQLACCVNAGMGEVIAWIWLVKQSGYHPFGPQVFTDFTGDCSVTQISLQKTEPSFKHGRRAGDSGVGTLRGNDTSVCSPTAMQPFDGPSGAIRFKESGAHACGNS